MPRVTGPITTTGIADVYPTHIAEFGKGGLMTMADAASRDAIPAERREQGMVVFTQNDSNYWVLSGLSWAFNDTDWTNFATATVPEATFTASGKAKKIEYNAFDYGAIGDGNSHPLSDFYGTLGAAQVVYPFATSLTNEIDRVAIQKGLTAAGATGSTLRLPTTGFAYMLDDALYYDQKLTQGSTLGPMLLGSMGRAGNSPDFGNLGSVMLRCNSTFPVGEYMLSFIGPCYLKTAATGTITNGNATNVSDGDTITIGATTYRFKNTMTTINDVQIGASADASSQSLIYAINGAGTVGTDYFTGTVANASVTAGTLATHVFTVTARATGVTGNTIGFSTTSSHLTLGNNTGGHLNGALDPIDQTIGGGGCKGISFDCNSRGAGVRLVNTFSSNWHDLLIFNGPQTPNPSIKGTTGTYSMASTFNGAFSTTGSPSVNSFHNSFERIFVQDAEMDGFELFSGAGSFDQGHSTFASNCGRYGYNVSEKCTLVNAMAQSNAQTKGLHGADFNIGSYNVTLIGPIVFAGKPKYGSGIKVGGGAAAIQKVIGGTIYGPINPEQDLSEPDASAVQIGQNLQNIEFIGTHFVTGHSTFTKHFIDVDADVTGRVTFTACQFLQNQGDPLTGSKVAFHGNDDIVSFVNCDGINTVGYRTWGNLTNAQQSIQLIGTPTGGTFTITWNGATTSPLAYNASPATIQTALRALASVGGANVTCTGGSTVMSFPVIVTFTGTLANAVQPAMTADTSLLTGGATPHAEIITILPGGPSMTFDPADGDYQKGVLSGDISPVLTNGYIIGQIWNLGLQQDATGSRVCTWPTNSKRGPVLSTAANAYDYITFRWDGTYWQCVGASMQRTSLVSEGGTGAGTLSGVLKGNGTAAFTGSATLTDVGAPTADFSMASHKITALTDPTNSQDAATMQWVLNQLNALDSKDPVAYASTAALPANTYANGASGVGATLTGNANGFLIIDGVTLAIGHTGLRVLVAAESTASHNGWYIITDPGSLITPYILTRANDSDQAAEIMPGYITSVSAPTALTGGANNGKAFISSSPTPFVVGTSNLTFSALGSTYSAGTGLGLSGTVFSIDTSVVVDKTTAQTLTNKNVTSATNIFATVTTMAASATPTPTGDSRENELYVTAQNAAATFGVPSGTPANGNKVFIRIKDDGTARALGFNAIYRFSSDLAQPTTTILGKTLYMAFRYNSTDAKYDCLAILNNFT